MNNKIYESYFPWNFLTKRAHKKESNCFCQIQLPLVHHDLYDSSILAYAQLECIPLQSMPFTLHSSKVHTNVDSKSLYQKYPESSHF